MSEDPTARELAEKACDIASQAAALAGTEAGGAAASAATAQAAATTATAQAGGAGASATAAAGSLAGMKAIMLGSFAGDAAANAAATATGIALAAGTLYFSTLASKLRVWSGGAWGDYDATAQAAATTATAQAGGASASATAAAGSLAGMKAIMLGSFASDADANAAGIALAAGALYFSTSSAKLRVWSGGAWGDYDASAQTAATSATAAAASAQTAATSATAAAASATAALSLPTRTQAMAGSVSALIFALTTSGYAVFGDGGGATYRRVSGDLPSDSSSFTAADGSKWQIVDDGSPRRPEAHGAVAGAGIDNTAAVMAAAASAKRVKFGPGTYSLSDAIALNNGHEIELSAGTVILQTNPAKNAFVATLKADIQIRLNGGSIKGSGGWSSGWTGNQGHEGVRGIQFWGCTRPKVIGPGTVYNFGNAQIGINGGTGWVVSLAQLEGTHNYGTPLSAGSNFQNGLYIANDATYGAADAGLLLDPDISGVAQGILRELPTSTNMPATMTHFIGGKVHDIPGQHGVYNQAGRLTALGMAFERCNLSGFKTQSADANQDLQDVTALGIATDTIGGALFEIATIGTGSINNSRFVGTGRVVGYLASLNGKMTNVLVDVNGDTAANALNLIGAGINASIKLRGTNISGAGIVCTATGSDITVEPVLKNVNTANSGGSAFGVLATYSGGSDDVGGAATTLRLVNPKICSPNGYMANAIQVGRTQTTVIVEGSPTFADATGVEQYVNSAGTIRSAQPRSWTPTFTAASGAFTSVTTNKATFWQDGKNCYLYLDFTLTSIGTAGGAIYVTLPANAGAASSLAAEEDVATGAIMRAAIRPGNLTRIDIQDATGSNPIGAGRRFIVTGMYQG